MQSFFIALIRNSISTRNMLSAGVILKPRRNDYPRRGPGKKFKKIFSKKSHLAENCRTVPRIPYPISYYVAEHT